MIFCMVIGLGVVIFNEFPAKLQIMSGRFERAFGPHAKQFLVGFTNLILYIYTEFRIKVFGLQFLPGCLPNLTTALPAHTRRLYSEYNMNSQNIFDV